MGVRLGRPRLPVFSEAAIARDESESLHSLMPTKNSTGRSSKAGNHPWLSFQYHGQREKLFFSAELKKCFPSLTLHGLQAIKDP